MTACDIAAITKPWEIQKAVSSNVRNINCFKWLMLFISNQYVVDFFMCQVAELVASEFFEQGDIEKEELKIIPIVSKRKFLIKSV